MASSLNHVQVTTERHGTYEANAIVVDLMMLRHLPASPLQLRAIAADQAGHDFDDVNDVSTLLVILADFAQASELPELARDYRRPA